MAERLLFINSRGDQIEIAHKYPFILRKVSGTGSTETTKIATQSPGTHGEILYDLLLEPRDIAVSGWVEGKTPADMYEQRRALVRTLNTMLGVGSLYYTNDYKTYLIYGTALNLEFTEKRGQRYTAFTVDFHCPSPFWREVLQTTAMLAFLKGAYQYPLKFPTSFGSVGYKATLNVRSALDTPVEISIFGPALRPVIENQTTGKRIKVSKELLAEEVLFINTDDDNTTVEITNTNTGITENAFGYVALETDNDILWKLRPGANKVVYYSENDAAQTRVLLRHSTLYMGV